jgi:hypothetical protein
MDYLPSKLGHRHTCIRFKVPGRGQNLMNRIVAEAPPKINSDMAWDKSLKNYSNLSVGPNSALASFVAILSAESI